eukprot:scaffold1969_cov130-Isochrysis_galbana.AAC.2
MSRAPLARRRTEAAAPPAPMPRCAAGSRAGCVRACGVQCPGWQRRRRERAADPTGLSASTETGAAARGPDRGVRKEARGPTR